MSALRLSVVSLAWRTTTYMYGKTGRIPPQNLKKMKNRMTMNQLSTYLPFWEEMEKRLSKSIERKDLAEVQSILNRAYMKALEVGFEEGVKNMYSEQDMEAFAEWTAFMQWIYDHTDKCWFQKHSRETITTAQLREIWEKERKEATE